MNVFANTFSWQKTTGRQQNRIFGGPVELDPHASPAYAAFGQGVLAERLPGLWFNGFMEAPMLPVAQVVDLLRLDIGSGPRTDLDREFLAACEAGLAASLDAA